MFAATETAVDVIAIAIAMPSRQFTEHAPTTPLETRPAQVRAGLRQRR